VGRLSYSCYRFAASSHFGKKRTPESLQGLLKGHPRGPARRLSRLGPVSNEEKFDSSKFMYKDDLISIYDMMVCEEDGDEGNDGLNNFVFSFLIEFF